MGLQLFFEITQDFFEQLNPNFCEEYTPDDNMVTLFQVCREFFDQMGQQFYIQYNIKRSSRLHSRKYLHEAEAQGGSLTLSVC